MTRFALGAVLFALALQAGAAVDPQEISAGIFTIEYWPGDEHIATEALDLLEKGLADFSRRLPPGNQPIRVTLCRTLQEFQARAGQYGRAWVGGVARAHSGVITVKTPALLPGKQDFRGLLRHELLHVLLARNIDENNSPRWFNEGVAMVISGEYRWGSMARVARMFASRRVIPYHNLDFAFLPMGDEILSGDAYAQALSMTRFLIDRIGEDKFWDLVLAMRQVPFETALMQSAALNPGAFYAAWRRSLWKLALITGSASAFSVFNIMIVLLFLAWARKRRQNRIIMQLWEEEDGAPSEWHNHYVSPEKWQEEDNE